MFDFTYILLLIRYNMSVVDQIHLKKEGWYNSNDISATAADHRILLIEPNSKEVDI